MIRKRNVLALGLALALAAPVTAYAANGRAVDYGIPVKNSGRAAEIKSQGYLSGAGPGGESIVIDSGDLVSIAQGLDDLQDYYAGALTEAYSYGMNDLHGEGTYMSAECEHHVHSGNDMTYVDSTVLYQRNNPGGCFVAAGHTHDKTGSCPSCTHWYRPMVSCGGSMHLISWHDYGMFKAKQYQCGNCGHIQRLEWSWGSSEPSGPGGCGNRIPGDPVQSHDRDCSHEQNTWVIGCGCTSATRESMVLSFLTESQPVPEVNSYGTYFAGDDSGGVNLAGSDIQGLASDFGYLFNGYLSGICDRFLSGVAVRSNPGKPSYTKLVSYHNHTDACYNGDTVICGKDSSTVESLSLFWYGSGTKFHIHSGFHAGIGFEFDGFKDDAILKQRDDPGGCFRAVSHEHDAECEMDTVVHPAVYCDGTVKNDVCDTCGKEYTGITGVQDCTEIIREEWTEESYACNDSPLNVWEIGCGNTADYYVD